MRRLPLALICTVACLGVGPGAAAAAKKHAPAHLMIDAQEYSLWASRSSVPAGKLLVELWNRGQDLHDAWIRRLNAAGQMVGPVLGRVPVTMPGRISQAIWHLKAGRYELYCSMPGHMALGMHAKLRVSRT
jgi:hypothetical protein